MADWATASTVDIAMDGLADVRELAIIVVEGLKDIEVVDRLFSTDSMVAKDCVWFCIFCSNNLDNPATSCRLQRSYARCSHFLMYKSKTNQASLPT